MQKQTSSTGLKSLKPLIRVAPKTVVVNSPKNLLEKQTKGKKDTQEAVIVATSAVASG